MEMPIIPDAVYDSFNLTLVLIETPFLVYRTKFMYVSHIGKVIKTGFKLQHVPNNKLYLTSKFCFLNFCKTFRLA
jgi:hypothetical protein